MSSFETRDWVSRIVAGRLAGVSRDRIDSWANKGLIGTRTLPGMSRQYNRADLVALVQRSTIPMSQTGSVTTTSPAMAS